MLPTVLRRWPLCDSYFVWLCDSVTNIFYMLSLILLFVLIVLVLFSIMITSVGDDRAGIYDSRALVYRMRYFCFFISSS